MKTKRLGDIQEGDRVMGSDGLPATVTRAHGEHLPQRMFEIEFDDGGKIEASGNHLWYIETQEDRRGLRKRMKLAQKILKDLPAEVEEGLSELAQSEGEEELYLDEMIEVLALEVDGEIINGICVRIAEALGHVAEDTLTHQDLLTGSTIEEFFHRSYDGRLFAQQVLALRDPKLRKTWPVVGGRVVTTQQLFDFYDDENIPLVKPLVR
jgi:hypothetical protein